MALQTGIGSRSLSLKLASRSWEIREGQVFRIGRHPSNDLQLNDPRVSRFHAEVRWQDGWPALRDLDSYNGTVVDGHPFAGDLSVEEGQKISIGRWILTVAFTEAPALVEDEDDTFGLFGGIGASDEVGTFASQNQLHRLLLDFESVERTGTVQLACAKGVAGTVTVCLGRVVAASCSGLTGIPALERLLRVHVGTYRYRQTFQLCDNTLDLSVRRYLREGFWAATKRHVRVRRKPAPPKRGRPAA